MSLFNKDAFSNANKKVRDNSNFTDVDNGFYICELNNAYIGMSKSSNRRQAAFLWKIEADDETFPGKTIGQYIGLEPNPAAKMSGEEILNIVLSTMDIDLGWLAQEMEHIPSEQMDDWFNKFLEKLVGTKARIQISDSNTEGFKNIRIKKVMYQPLEDVMDQESFSGDTSPASPAVAAQVEKTVELEKGQMIEYEAASEEEDGGVTHTASVEMIDGDKIVIKQSSFDGGGTKIINSSQIVNILVDNVGVTSPTSLEELQPESLEQPNPTHVKLEIGMNVTGQFNGQMITGPIHAIEDDLIKIAFDGKAYPCQRSTINVLT